MTMVELEALPHAIYKKGGSKMKNLFIILFVLIICSCAHWSKEQKIMEAMTAATYIIDCGQTLDIAKNPSCYKEMNPIIGEHPSKGRVKSYFAGLIVTHLLISSLLEPKQRDLWQKITLIISGGNVSRNYGLGLKINF